jgi:hypothetical protein
MGVIGIDRTILAVAGLLVAVFAAWLLYSYDPSVAGTFPRCPSNLLTNLYCPGCGSLRALHHLLNGSVMQALSYNGLMVVSIPVLAWMVFEPAWVRHPSTPWLVFATIVGYAILRNIPLWPFSVLAPGTA